MADKKISQLPAASALAGTEELPVVQSATTKKATVNQIITLAETVLSVTTVITDATTARTLSATDSGKILYFTSASAVTVTCATGLGKGFNCTIIQGGAGKITVAPGAATLNSFAGLFATIGQYAVISLISPVDGEFIAAGNLGA